MGDDHCNLITFLPVSQVSQICGASLQVRTKHSSTTTLVNHLCLLGNSRILSASPVILAITCSPNVVGAGISWGALVRKGILSDRPEKTNSANCQKVRQELQMRFVSNSSHHFFND